MILIPVVDVMGKGCMPWGGVHAVGRFRWAHQPCRRVGIEDACRGAGPTASTLPVHIRADLRPLEDVDEAEVDPLDREQGAVALFRGDVLAPS